MGRIKIKDPAKMIEGSQHSKNVSAEPIIEANRHLLECNNDDTPKTGQERLLVINRPCSRNAATECPEMQMETQLRPSLHSCGFLARNEIRRSA